MSDSAYVSFDNAPGIFHELGGISNYSGHLTDRHSKTFASPKRGRIGFFFSR